MAHSTQFTFVAGDMTFTLSLPSRRLADYMGVQAIGVARRYDYWASRDYTKADHFLTHLGLCSTRIVSEMVKEWEELLGDEDESGPQNIMLHNQFYVEITHFD